MPNGRTGITQVRKDTLLSTLKLLNPRQQVGVLFGQLITAVHASELKVKIDHYESDTIEVEEHGSQAYIIRFGVDPAKFVAILREYQYFAMLKQVYDQQASN